MSFLYRPTPVISFNPAPVPPRLNPTLRGPSGGMMRGYQTNVNWHSFFEEARRACKGKPWIERSGTMGSFVLGQDDTGAFDETFPFPTDIGGSLTTLPLPDSFFSLEPPAAPVITTPDMAPPTIPASLPFGVPSITFAPNPPVPMPSGPTTSTTPQIISSAGSLISSIKQAVSPTPRAPSTQIPGTTTQAQANANQAAALRAQAAQLQATNPALAAQYLAQANALSPLPGTGAALTSWFSAPSALFPSMTNGTVLLLAVAGVAAVAAVGGGGYYYAGRRR